MNHPNPISLSHPIDALEGRFALRVAALLSEQAQYVNADVTRRLRFARERALQAAQRARALELAAATITTNGSTALAGGRGSSSWWVRLAAMAPVVALVCGLVLIQKSQTAAQVAVAAEVDAALLSDDLPPSAYSDAGFVEFLRTTPRW